MDLHFRPDASKQSTRDGARPSEIARQRPALAARIQGRESFHDFDANHTLRGGHFTENEYGGHEFVMDETEQCERMNRDLRRGHTLDVRGDAE